MKTTTKENGLEIKVGLFLCIGILIIGAMVLEFSLGGKKGFKKYYSLFVDLPNANGLLKGSDVLLAGSSVGYVADKPVLAPDLSSVRVMVMVNETIKIPKDSIFKVDSSGLLGDKFVSVQTPPDFDAKTFNPNDASHVYQPGTIITGTHAPDIAEIAAQAGPVLKKLSDELGDLQVITANLKEGVLSGSSQKNLQDTFVNLKTTSENFAQASKGIAPIVQNAQEAVDKAKETMATADLAAADLRKVLDSARALIQKAQQGDGLVGQLINNRQLADNFNALVINLREHGVLFYRDSAAKNAAPAATQTPTPAARKRR